MINLDLKELDLNKFKNFFNKLKIGGKKSAVGVDISTNRVKLVQLEKKKNKLFLKNYAIGRVDYNLTNFNQTGTCAVDEAVGKVLKKILANNDTKAKEINLAIPSFTALVTVFDIYNVGEKVDLESMIRLEAEKYIPVSIEDVIYDWQIIEEEKISKDRKSKKDKKIKENFKKNNLKNKEAGEGGKKIMLVAIMKDISCQYEKAIGSAGLNINALEISSLSLIRSLIGRDKKNYILLDIGDKVCDINFIVKGSLVFHKNNNFAGNKITQSLARTLNVSEEKAEALKIEKGMKAGMEGAGRMVFEPFLNALTKEVSEAQKTFEKNYPTKKIESVILSGGSSYLKGLKETLEKRFGLGVYWGNPWSKINYPEKLEKDLVRLGPSLAVAVGLAMLELDESD